MTIACREGVLIIQYTLFKYSLISLILKGYVTEIVHKAQSCKLGGIGTDAVLYPIIGTIGKALVLTI
jgi:hypothetical protein